MTVCIAFFNLEESHLRVTFNNLTLGDWKAVILKQLQKLLEYRWHSYAIFTVIDLDVV